MRFLIGLLALCALMAMVYGQKVTVSVFDQHPSKNPNFEPSSDGSMVKGLVKPTLTAPDGVTKIPQLVSTSVTNQNNIDAKLVNPQLFPFFFAADHVGKTNYPMQLDLTFNASIVNGETIYTLQDDLFFPIDNEGFDDPAVWGGVDPKWTDTTGKQHNFHFCIRMNSAFTMKKGLTFNFTGDDDVWLFINNQLVVDLGSIHYMEHGSISLDTISPALTIGTTYPFDFYYCERKSQGSHIKIQTTILQKCEPNTIDYCGVCFGTGDTCCNSQSDCVNAQYPASNKCVTRRCPIGNTPGVIPGAGGNLGSKCSYTVIPDDTQYKCNPGVCDTKTGKQVYTPVPLVENECRTPVCNNATGISYLPSKCDFNLKCQDTSCVNNKCVYTDIEDPCPTDNKCLIPTCDNSKGCSFAQKQPVDPKECLIYTCDPKTGDFSSVPVDNCNACEPETRKCEIATSCNADPIHWNWAPRNIDDGNACTIDACTEEDGITHTPVSCPGGCSQCDPAQIVAPGQEPVCSQIAGSCDDLNACTLDQCAANGTCINPPVVCENADPCKVASCDATNGCTFTDMVCEDLGLCQVGYCSAGKCEYKNRECASPAFCLEARCDLSLGCLINERECVPDNDRCNVGVCNNETASCEDKKKDPLPFSCKTAAVISTAVIAGIVVAAAVALGLAIFGGKKGYDYWKDTQNHKINVSSANPLYEANPTGGENPMFADK
eukprot:gene12118-14176_t